MLDATIATAEIGLSASSYPSPSSREPNRLAPIAELPETEANYDRGEEICGEGEPTTYVYRVISGAVRTYKVLRDGRRQIDAFYLPGEAFGLNAGDTHLVTAEAIVDTTLAVMKKRTLEHIARTNAEVAFQMWRIAADDVQRAQERSLLLGRKNALERVIAFLLEMDRRLSVSGIFALPMCRRDIGDYLGLTLETVSRTLTALADKRALTFSGARQIELHNRARLQAMTG